MILQISAKPMTPSGQGASITKFFGDFGLRDAGENRANNLKARTTTLQIICMDLVH